MHFHIFGPPHFHVLPIILSSALTVAAGAYVIARYGVPAGVTNLGTRLKNHIDAWRAAADRPRLRGAALFSRAGTVGGSRTGNAAFDDYRTATLKKLEEEGAEFRTYLNGLRHAKDRGEFDAFLNERRERNSATSTP